MNHWVTLLRGVNVGGHNKMPMAAFRAALGDAGLQDVATYIQTGNAVFRSDYSRDAILTLIDKALTDAFGLQVDIFVLKLEELQSAIANNPFAQASDDPKTLHLFFLACDVETLDETALTALATKGEQFALHGKVFYLYTPNGYGRSELATKLARYIKTSMTARNLRSCKKIAELAAGL